MAKKRAAVPANKPKVPAAKSGIRAMIEARRKAMAGKSESPADENKVRVIKLRFQNSNIKIHYLLILIKINRASKQMKELLLSVVLKNRKM